MNKNWWNLKGQHNGMRKYDEWVTLSQVSADKLAVLWSCRFNLVSHFWCHSVPSLVADIFRSPCRTTNCCIAKKGKRTSVLDTRFAAKSSLQSSLISAKKAQSSLWRVRQPLTIADYCPLAYIPTVASTKSNVDSPWSASNNRSRTHRQCWFPEHWRWSR